MTKEDLEQIWVLDDDHSSRALYERTLNSQYDVRCLESVDELFTELTLKDSKRPRLLISDPENTTGSFAASLGRLRGWQQSNFYIPDFVIASRIDNLELIRFYLRCGARDYFLKPLRETEVLAKLERILDQISTREVTIAVDDLDGIKVADLTLRERQLLNVFLATASRSVKREDLYTSVWTKTSVNRKTLDVHLYNLRRKLRIQGYDVFYKEYFFTLRKI